MVDSQDTLLNNKWKKRPYRVEEQWSTLAIFKDNKLVLKKFNQEIKDAYNIQTNTFYTQKYLKDDSACTSIVKYFNSIRKAFKIEHQLRDEYWELAAEGEKETLLQKYYRLKFETEELLKEYCSHEEENNDWNRKKLYTNIDFKIRNILEKLTKYSNDGYFQQSRTFEVCNLENYIVTKLLNNILYTNDKERLIFKNIPENLNNKVIKKSIQFKVDKLSKISQLEIRLRKLEMIIGSEQLMLKHLGGNSKDGLVKAVCSLKEFSKQIISQVNKIESRDLNILPKLKQIATKLNNQNIDGNEKINKLYETILKAKEESHLLPHIIQRMTILDNFHHQVSTFAVTIENQRVQYAESSKTLKNNELLINDIDSHIDKNTSIVVFSLQSLLAQIEVLDNQLKNKKV